MKKYRGQTRDEKRMGELLAKILPIRTKLGEMYKLPYTDELDNEAFLLREELRPMEILLRQIEDRLGITEKQ